MVVPEFADRQLKEQQELYDAGWQGELKRGKEQRGNLETNLAFVAQTGLLKPGDRIVGVGPPGRTLATTTSPSVNRSWVPIPSTGCSRSPIAKFSAPAGCRYALCGS